MKLVGFGLMAGLSLLEIGCLAIPESNVQRETKPKTSVGYAGGVFSNSQSAIGIDKSDQGFGFGLINMTTRKEYLLPFYSWPFGEANMKPSARMIELPPAEYKISYWVIYDRMMNRISKKEIESSNTFTVKPGKIYYIGSFVTEEYTYDRHINWTWHGTSMTKLDIKTKFKEAYPEFPDDALEFTR